MQRINRNRMGPSFPKAPPARLPMMDFRAKPGFEQKYNILPDISGIRKEMEEDYQHCPHDEQFTHSWQSPAVSMGAPVNMGGQKSKRKNNGHEVRMPFNRESGQLIDGFYNEPNDFNPGIQRTLTQNHNILTRPCDPFTTTKNGCMLNNPRVDRTFITPNVDMTLYGTKNNLPGISKREKTNVETKDKTEDGGFMKRVKSSHTLNVHLPRDKEPLMAIKPKNEIEKPSDDFNYANEKQGHINIVPERFAEIMKEEIRKYNNRNDEYEYQRHLQSKDNKFEENVSAQNGKDSTDCTSFGDDDMAYPGNLNDSIKMDRQEKLGIESSNESNKSFSYESTDNEDNIRRGSYPDIMTIQPDSMMCTNQEVEVGFEICDGDGTASIGNFNDSIKEDRNEKLGIESSNESNKSFSYEETEKEESGVKDRTDESDDGDVRRGTCPETVTVRRDSMMGINHEVEVEFEICDDEKSVSAGYGDGSNKADRRQKLGFESSNESVQSCSYETSEMDGVNTIEAENDSCIGNSGMVSCPQIMTIRRDGMTCVNHEVEIEYEICDDETESEDKLDRNETESLKVGAKHDIEIHDESVESSRASHDANLSQNEIKQLDLKEDDSSKVDEREKLGIESSNESNQSYSYEASEIEGECYESCGHGMMKPYPEIITIRRDGMTCVSHEVEIEYDVDENEESYESESEDILESKKGERRISPLGEETPDAAYKSTDNKEHIREIVLQNEINVYSKHVLDNEVSENKKEIEHCHRNEITTLDGAESNTQSGSNNDLGIDTMEKVNGTMSICVEKHTASRDKDQVQHELDNTNIDDGPRISVNLEETKKDAIHEGESGYEIGLNNTGQSADSANVVCNDNMKCVGYEVEKYAGSVSGNSISSDHGHSCSDRMVIRNTNKQGGPVGHSDKWVNQTTDNMSVLQLSRSNVITSDKVNREAVERKRPGKDTKPTKHVRESEKESSISKINVERISEIIKHEDLSLQDKVKNTENSDKEKANDRNIEKCSKDKNIRTVKPQKGSTRVIAIDPETVKREHRKRKRERDKICKIVRSVTKPSVQRKNAKTPSGSIDSLSKAIESNTGQITYETDDDIDIISDKILDQKRESCSKMETNEQRLQMKCTKRVTFDDELRVYNIKSISSTSSYSPINRNTEDSTDNDTVYDTDDDIDKISNDILDEFDDEKQTISKQNIEDKNVEIVNEKQNNLSLNVKDESFVAKERNNINMYHEMPELSKDFINPVNVSKDKLAKTYTDEKVVRVADDMKLTLKKDVCEKKRRNSFDMISTERKVSDIHETHNKAIRDITRNQTFNINTRGKAERYNNDNSDNYKYLRGAAIAQKNIAAAGDGDITSTVTATGKSEVEDISIKLLTIRKKNEENCSRYLFKIMTAQTEKRANGIQTLQNGRFEYYESGVHRSELYKRIMSILETKVGRERADTLMRSKTINDMIENLTTNPEKYGKRYADLLKLREERSFLDLTQLINDPSRVEDENRPWCYFERMKILALSSDSRHEHKQHGDEFSDSDIFQLNDETQTDFNRNADVGKSEKIGEEIRNNKGTQQNRSRRKFSFKSFFRKFICVCKSKVDHEDI